MSVLVIPSIARAWDPYWLNPIPCPHPEPLILTTVPAAAVSEPEEEVKPLSSDSRESPARAGRSSGSPPDGGASAKDGVATPTTEKVVRPARSIAVNVLAGDLIDIPSTDSGWRISPNSRFVLRRYGRSSYITTES